MSGQDTPIRAAPHSLDAEQALLGVLLYDNAAFEYVGGLQGAHFYEPFHGRLFDAIAAAIVKGGMADPILMDTKFGGDLAYAELSGLRYLADLVDRAPPAANIRDYAAVVMDLGLKRMLIRAAGEIAFEAGDPDAPGSAADQLAHAEQRLYAIAERGVEQGGAQGFGHYLTGALERAAEAMARDGGLAGIATCLTDLDAKVGGLIPSDLIVLAGRPAMGKTALATNIAFNIARRYAYERQPDGAHKTVDGGRVLFYSLEMSGEQLALRILASAARVSGDKLRKGEIDPSAFGRVRDAAVELQEIPLSIDATGGLSLAKLVARARRMKRRQGLDLIVVDYLQLIDAGLSSGANRVQELTVITVGLKALAKELDCPIIALSQLSRKVEEREDKRPQLADLRESGSIEQDADQVWFVFRPEYYHAAREPREGTAEHLEWLAELERIAGLADVIIAKQRHGPTGTVQLSFDGDTTTFSNLSRDRRP
ncbi:replicative DNA helicase [Caulobacter sp. CCNWLY153]|uniref:replicative DNA helicase n=1 Tax=unclassified Caulobacter TaxID=2648921 RepID=UPI002FEF951E